MKIEDMFPFANCHICDRVIKRSVGHCENCGFTPVIPGETLIRKDHNYCNEMIQHISTKDGLLKDFTNCTLLKGHKGKHTSRGLYWNKEGVFTRKGDKFWSKAHPNIYRNEEYYNYITQQEERKKPYYWLIVLLYPFCLIGIVLLFLCTFIFVPIIWLLYPFVWLIDFLRFKKGVKND